MTFMDLRLSIPITLLAATVLAGCTQQVRSAAYWVYFGTGADHIYVSSFNPATGALGAPRPAAEIGRPGFLAIHPEGGILYAVGREGSGQAGFRGIAAAYRIDSATGGLEELNRAPTAGRGAAHVAVDPSGSVLAAVNYGDGNTVSVSLETDGRLGSLVSDIAHEGSSVHPQRQTGPHPHSANFTPDGRLVLVPDLGTDELVAFAVDSATAQLDVRAESVVEMDPGSGPRHMTFHPNGRWAYVINELASTVAAFEYDPESLSFSALQTIGTLPADYDGPANTTAEVLVHPSGRFLYGSNRGSNTLAVFEVDPSDGRLAPLERVSTGGDWPRNFRLAPEGDYVLVANQRSDDVHVFAVDPETGRLTPTGASVDVPNPMCVRFVPAS